MSLRATSPPICSWPVRSLTYVCLITCTVSGQYNSINVNSHITLRLVLVLSLSLSLSLSPCLSFSFSLWFFRERGISSTGVWERHFQETSWLCEPLTDNLLPRWSRWGHVLPWRRTFAIILWVIMCVYDIFFWTSLSMSLLLDLCPDERAQQ